MCAHALVNKADLKRPKEVSECLTRNNNDNNTVVFMHMGLSHCFPPIWAVSLLHYYSMSLMRQWSDFKLNLCGFNQGWEERKRVTRLALLGQSSKNWNASWRYNLKITWKKKLPKLCQTSNSNSHLKPASYLLMKWATLSALWVPSASAGSFEEGFEHTKQKQSGHFMPQARFWWHLTARKAISFTIQSQTPLIAREVCCSLGNTLWYFSSLIFAVHLSLCLFPCGENWFTRVVILIWH